jgi:hypothetical protein
MLLARDRTDRITKLEAKYKKVMEGVRVEDSEVVVVHEVGRIARKFAKEFILGVGNQVVRFSFPSIETRPLFGGGTGVEIRGGRFYEGENTAYLDAIARDTLENRRGRLVAKQMTRLLAKGQLTYQAEKNFGPLAGLAANIATAATETADTRSWTTLPQAFYITRAKLPPGTSEVVIKTAGRIGEIKKLTAQKGKIHLLRGIE